MSSSFDVQLGQLLNEYSKEVDEVTKEVMKEVADQTADKLRSTSPRRTGKYASGWKVKKDKDAYIVHNTVYRLTHLLENSHVIRNKKGTYGRSTPQKHIEPAEQWASEQAQTEIKRRLEH